MRRSLPALIAAATIASALSPSTPAEAGWWRAPPARIIVASPFAGPYVTGYYGYYAPPLVYQDYYQPAPVYYSYYPLPPRPLDCRRWRRGC
jgi:hypothetical protein